MFWSLLLEPGKRYSKVVDDPFHLSAAVVDSATQEDGIVGVMVDIGDTETLIGNLSVKHGILQCPLNLEFASGSSVSFYTVGAKCNVHLSGFVMYEEQCLVDGEDDDEEESSDEEVPTLVSSSETTKRKPEESPTQANKKARLQKVTPGSPNKAPPAGTKGSPKKQNKANVSSNNKVNDADDSDEDDEDEEMEEEEEEEDSSMDDDEEEEEEGEEEEEEDEEGESDEDDDSEAEEFFSNLFNRKKTVESVEENFPTKKPVNVFKQEKKGKAEHQTPKDANKIQNAMNKTPKTEGNKSPAEGKKTPKGDNKIIKSEANQTPKQSNKTPKDANKKNKNKQTPGAENGKTPKGSQQANNSNMPTQNGKTPKSDTPAKKENKSPRIVKSGGVVCEDLKVGTGPEAKPGRMVSVYYEGRLESNKLFDKCDNGKGFKFRLGGNEVIKGWDVGVSGMKVGGSRKIICPPHMAYGKKGAPPDIPANATLVFKVELKGIN